MELDLAMGLSSDNEIIGAGGGGPGALDIQDDIGGGGTVVDNVGGGGDIQDAE